MAIVIIVDGQMKSYSKNNNNHLVIIPKTCGLLTK